MSELTLADKARRLAREAAATRARQDFCTELSNLADAKQAQREAAAEAQRQMDLEQADKIFNEEWERVYEQTLSELRTSEQAKEAT